MIPVSGDNGLIDLIHCVIAAIRKYTFDKRVNWMNNAFGRKVKML
jgi:hypothetical protein